jgi:predicted GTPase
MLNILKTPTTYIDYRKEDIDKKISVIGYNPLDIMVTGVTGAGKSTTLNSLFQRKVAKEGDGVDPETMEIATYTLSDKRIRLWDTPGLGDGIDMDIAHSKNIINRLNEFHGNQFGFIDMVLVILDGGSRDLGTTYKLLNEVIVPNMPKNRILIAINQCDMGMKGKNWDTVNNAPNDLLVEQLELKNTSVVNRIKEATGIQIKKPIYYSAKYNYNIYKLLDLIIDNLPSTPRKVKKR